MDVLTMVLAGVFAVSVTGSGWLTVRYFRPKHFFTAFSRGGGERRIRMKNPSAESFTVADPTDDRKVMFPLDLTFARIGPKGSVRYYGDMDTGLLLQWRHQPPGWVEMDGKYLAQALEDGRERNLVSATTAGPYDKFLQFVPLLLIVVVVMSGAALWFLYQMYQHKSG